MNRISIWLCSLKFQLFIWMGCRIYKHFNLATERVTGGHRLRGVVFSNSEEYIKKVKNIGR